MTPPTLLRRALLPAVISALALSACYPGTPPGVPERAAQILAECDGPVAVDAQIDVSGSSQSTSLGTGELAVVEDAAMTAALCGGRVRVSLFTASAAANRIVFEDSVVLHGATDAAKLRRVSDAADDVVNKVEAAWPDAVSGLAALGGGTDVVSRLTTAAEFSRQVGDDHQLVLIILTDGVNTTADIAPAQAGSLDEAAALADRVAVPDLTGAEVTIAGLGRVAGGVMEPAAIDRLKAFFAELCERSSAETCLTVTDFSGGR